MDKGKIVHNMQGHTANIWAMTLTPDGRYVVSGGDDKKVIIWDANSYKKITELKGHTENVRSLSVSTDGKYLAAGGGKQVTIWDLAKILSK